MGGKMSKIVPGVYVGGVKSFNNEDELSANEITHILSVYHLSAKDSLKGKTSRKHKEIIADDHPRQNLEQYFLEASLFIHEARVNNGSCLIHCMVGVSRSVTMCVAYLMAITGLPFEQTLNSVQGRRNCANPNEGFCQQLAQFESSGRAEEVRKALEEKFGVWNRKEEDLDMLKIGLNEFLTPASHRTYNDDGSVKSEYFTVSHHLSDGDKQLASQSSNTNTSTESGCERGDSIANTSQEDEDNQTV